VDRTACQSNVRLTRPFKIGQIEQKTVTAAQGCKDALNASGLFSMTGVNGHLARQLLSPLLMDLARPSAWPSTIPASFATPGAKSISSTARS
jgi:hypothetical protein